MNNSTVSQLSKDSLRDMKRQKNLAVQVEQQERLAHVSRRKQLPRTVSDLARSGADQQNIPTDYIGRAYVHQWPEQKPQATETDEDVPQEAGPSQVIPPWNEEGAQQQQVGRLEHSTLASFPLTAR